MSQGIPFHLNIRQKVTVGLVLSILVIGSIGIVSFHYLRGIEVKQRFVQVADDLSDTILEIRRYEKNYLLYGLPEDLEENRAYIQKGIEILAKIAPDVKELRGGPQLNVIEQEFASYRSAMERMAAHGRDGDWPGEAKIEDVVRERGKALVDAARQLVSFERLRILTLVGSLKTQLVAALIICLGMAAFLALIVGKEVIKPLRVIERTTLRIAQGDFSPLPVRDTKDETQRVVEAFNRMVAELEKRQDQLLQAKKLSSLGILTSGIAHQLNNPLNNISTSCQIVMEELNGGDPEFLNKMLGNIEQEVHRARDIVRGLLEFSRIKVFALAPTSLADVVKRSVSLISSQIPPGVEVVKDVPEDLVLSLDGQRMQQVFLNLLMNAIQAIDRPPGEIRITARPDAADGQASIVVSDTGAGIPESDLGRVFDPFFTTKEVGVGTGLGLSIVYGIVQKHQGSISVESREGEGTRFILRLPLSAEAQSTV